MPVSKLNLGKTHGEVVVRHNEWIYGLGTLLFIHGQGDSRQAFLEAFDLKGVQDYNLLAPDLPGCGNSPGGEEFSISSYIHCLEALLTHFGTKELIIVGHGFGADLGTWLAMRPGFRSKVRGLINIEGTVGKHSLKFGQMAIEAADDPQRTYHKWFRKQFSEDYILVEHIRRFPAYRRYHEALQLARPGSFLRLARERADKLHLAPDDPRCAAYENFLSLRIPKSYSLAEHGLNTRYRPQLERDLPDLLYYEGASHWLMCDQPGSFYHHLLTFCSEHLPQPAPTKRYYLWFMQRFREWLKGVPEPLRRIRQKLGRFFRTRVPLPTWLWAMLGRRRR